VFFNQTPSVRFTCRPKNNNLGFETLGSKPYLQRKFIPDDIDGCFYCGNSSAGKQGFLSATDDGFSA